MAYLTPQQKAEYLRRKQELLKRKEERIQPQRGSIVAADPLSAEDSIEGEALNQSAFGDTVDEFQYGLIDSGAGMAEMVGAEQIAGGLRSWRDDQLDTMTPEWLRAREQALFSEDENGDLIWGEGASDPRTWAAHGSKMAGHAAGMIGTGGVVGAGLKGVAKAGLSRAAAKSGMERGAASKLAERRLASKGPMGVSGNSATSHAGQAISAGTMITGMDIAEAKERYDNLPVEVKQDSEFYRTTFYDLAAKEYGLSPQQAQSSLSREQIESLQVLTDEVVKDEMSDSLRTDPVLLANNAVFGMLGNNILKGMLKDGWFASSGNILERALKRGAKGAGAEAVVEGIQEGVETYRVNEAVKEYADPGLDSMSGVKAAAATGAAVGGAVAGTTGTAGGALDTEGKALQRKKQLLMDQGFSDEDAEAIIESDNKEETILDKRREAIKAQRLKAEKIEAAAEKAESGLGIDEDPDLEQKIASARQFAKDIRDAADLGEKQVVLEAAGIKVFPDGNGNVWITKDNRIVDNEDGSPLFFESKKDAFTRALSIVGYGADTETETKAAEPEVKPEPAPEPVIDPEILEYQENLKRQKFGVIEGANADFAKGAGVPQVGGNRRRGIGGGGGAVVSTEEGLVPVNIWRNEDGVRQVEVNNDRSVRGEGISTEDRFQLVSEEDSHGNIWYHITDSLDGDRAVTQKTNNRRDAWIEAMQLNGKEFEENVPQLEQLDTPSVIQAKQATDEGIGWKKTRKQMEVGDEVIIDDPDVPRITVTSIHPLRGIYKGVEYSVPKKKILQVAPGAQVNEDLKVMPDLYSSPIERVPATTTESVVPSVQATEDAIDGSGKQVPGRLYRGGDVSVTGEGRVSQAIEDSKTTQEQRQKAGHIQNRIERLEEDAAKYDRAANKWERVKLHSSSVEEEANASEKVNHLRRSGNARRQEAHDLRVEMARIIKPPVNRPVAGGVEMEGTRQPEPKAITPVDEAVTEKEAVEPAQVQDEIAEPNVAESAVETTGLPELDSVVAGIHDIGEVYMPDNDDIGTAEQDTKTHQSIMPSAFQGGKSATAKSLNKIIRHKFPKADRKKITELHDYFGGGGGWGLFNAMAHFGNVKNVHVYEKMPSRMEKIKLFHNNGDKVEAFVKDKEVVQVLNQVVDMMNDSNVASASAMAKRIERLVEEKCKG